MSYAKPYGVAFFLAFDLFGFFVATLLALLVGSIFISILERING